MTIKKICSLSLLLLLVSGCSYLTPKPSRPLTPREQLCTELKRNIIFNTASTHSIDAASATQRAEMIRLYEKNNCANIKK